MNPKYVGLPIVVALALSLSACGQDADRTESGQIAQGPVTSSPAPGEQPASPGNPSGMSDTSPTIPNQDQEKKEEPFGQGSPQTAMKGTETPATAAPVKE